MRPKATVPKKRLCIMLPDAQHDWLELMFFSELQGRVPYGAISDFIEKLLRQEMEQSSIIKLNSLQEED